MEMQIWREKSPERRKCVRGPGKAFDGEGRKKKKQKNHKKTHQAAKGLKAEHDGKGAQKPRKCTEKREEKKTFRT